MSLYICRICGKSTDAPRCLNCGSFDIIPEIMKENSDSSNYYTTVCNSSDDKQYYFSEIKK